MPNLHGRQNYTLERMLDRRNRNTIRRSVERNGRRLSARELDILHICARNPDQRYLLLTFFSVDSDDSNFRVTPYVLPLPAAGHQQLLQNRLIAASSSNSEQSGSATAAAQSLLHVNTAENDADARTAGQSESGQPSSSRVTLPCLLLTDTAESSVSAGEESSSTINMIADTIIESLQSSPDNGNSEKGNSDKGSSEKGNSDKGSCEKGNSDKGSYGKGNSKKSSKKNSKKKKKKNQKKSGDKAGPSETQIGSENNPSEEPCVLSDSSSSSHVETSPVDGDGGNQRVKSDTETVPWCFSSNSSDRCHADISCSNSMVSSDDAENTVPVLPETVGPTDGPTNEDLSALEEMAKADGAQRSSDTSINNEFIPVVSGRRNRQCGRFSQQGSNPSRFAAPGGRSGDKFSTWQEKSPKKESREISAPPVKSANSGDSRTKTLPRYETSKVTAISSKPDLKPAPKPCPTTALVYSRKDHNSSGGLARDSGGYVFKKDDFPNLPPPNSTLKEVVTPKLGPKPPRKDRPPVPLPRKPRDQCKRSESEAGAETKISNSRLELKISELEESGSGSGSSSGAFFSPNSSKSSETNQSSHDTCGLDSPRSSKASDETQLTNQSSHDTNESHNASQSGRDSSRSLSDATGDNITDDVAQSGCDTCPSDSNNSVSTDIDSSRSGSSVCSSPTSTAPISPSTSAACLDCDEPKNMPAVCGTEEEILAAVRASHRIHQVAERVQSATGRPFADYELLCRYSSPVLNLPFDQIADMPLRKIWQWYEEPSCYALEVRGCQDHERLVNFTAHLVPSLSAVQLFVRRDPLPMFPKNLPNQGGSESAPELESMLHGGAGPAELAFEFFEYELPYVRRTLFEKVKELIGGVAQGSNSRHVEELQVGDLHPASWFCVAWYPAYRVPEGRSSFKAAFLTYHSLAHFVQVATPAASVTSPVVGLMAYNTKGESWFHLRSQEGGEIMTERLRLLNLTAAVMSRARVPRKSQVSGNRHPDYEFFATHNR